MDDDDDQNDALPEYGDLSSDTQGEIASMEPDEDSDVTETEDGVIVNLGGDEDEERSPDFYKNLAEEMDEGELDDLAATYLDLLEKDKEARKKRDDQYRSESVV